MRYYESGDWGFSLVYGYKASVFPRALALALPNACLAFLLSTWQGKHSEETQDMASNAFDLWAAYTSVLFFVLYFRSNVAYGRWWEGGTLLQQTRGEWFNAYSSLIAFVSSDPKREEDVQSYQHMLARLMSLLFCSALQQVSPDRTRSFDILDSQGLDPSSMTFLLESEDKVEVILQWLQRSTILSMQSGVLTAPPPVMSRAFQELSRGIVNLQNARKIADFPFPYPHAQASMVMLLLHWAMCPILASILLNRTMAAVTCFVVICFLWCIHFIALDLEYPFGTRDNDLPMEQMMFEWNKSVATLLAKKANQPPAFDYCPDFHNQFITVKSTRGQTIYTKGPLSREPTRSLSREGSRLSPCPSIFRKKAAKRCDGPVEQSTRASREVEGASNCAPSCNVQDGRKLSRASSTLTNPQKTSPPDDCLRGVGDDIEPTQCRILSGPGTATRSLPGSEPPHLPVAPDLTPSMASSCSPGGSGVPGLRDVPDGRLPGSLSSTSVDVD